MIIIGFVMPSVQETFCEGLREFTHGRDDFRKIEESAPPTLDGIEDGEVRNRSSFSRGTFEPSDNAFSQALSAWENGNREPLEAFIEGVREDTEIRERFVELEVNGERYGEDTEGGGIQLIRELILVHRGDIADFLGIERM